MSTNFEELDYRETPFGELVLRRRRVLSLDTDVFEVKLDGAFLMSSLVNASEIALAELGLAPLEAPELDVAVGGLGLGYTARAALGRPGVRSVLVVERLAEVIDWHRRGLVPLGPELTSDPRCRLVQGDFFAMLDGPGLDAREPDRRFHAVLVDIDHSPRSLLHPDHGSFYGRDGLRLLARRLVPGGSFALWSADPIDAAFREELDAVFASVREDVVEFENPLLSTTDRNTILVARAANGEEA